MFKNKFITYLSSEKRFSEHTIESYATDLKQFTSFLSAEFQIIDEINEISFQIIRTWIASLLEKGINPRSVNRKISTLKTYFKFLIREGELIENPMTKVVAPKSKKRLPVFIEEDQIASLLNEVEFEIGFVGQRNKLIIELFYVTGIRLSELINIKISDVDLNNQSIKVLGKRNKERIIPLSSNVVNDLNNFIENNQQNKYLFTNLDGNKLYTKLVYRLVNKYIGEISSVNKKSPHILRHTFATHMLNNGADINAIKELLGHANLSATQVYTHNTIEKLKTVYKQAHPRA
ncbi:MAG: tyrosine-type recombinase/integrase [Flavobacteriales bacterium]|jgi:integrase/recombinase XerC|nr:tyrosine-type recombinase/integrase [Flavobacteriales bacterium]MBT5749746.1 tyrosine-type recombinase/integrase [Flavobacteriales bacterium]